MGQTGRFFTRLDLRCSYRQCPVAPNGRQYLGLYWGSKVCRWTRMPMGARNSTAKF